MAAEGAEGEAGEGETYFSMISGTMKQRTKFGGTGAAAEEAVEAGKSGAMVAVGA